MDACKQAEKDFENIRKQVTALEERAVKALPGENRPDLDIVNSMLVKHRAGPGGARKIMAESKAKTEAGTASAKETKAQVDELLTWAECFDQADIETDT